MDWEKKSKRRRGSIDQSNRSDRKTSLPLSSLQMKQSRRSVRGTPYMTSISDPALCSRILCTACKFWGIFQGTLNYTGRPDSLIFPRAIYGCFLISERKNVPLIFKLAGGNSSTPHLKGLKNTNKMVFLKFLYSLWFLRYAFMRYITLKTPFCSYF